MPAPNAQLRRVRVLLNPRSGLGTSFGPLCRAIEQSWHAPGLDITYQVSRDVEDGRRKTRRAIADGVDTILVAGGDGMINTIGSLLVGREVALGVLPAGSGNGFARHFGIPLDLGKAARALAGARPMKIDVGRANGRPFFVTCSMAWDASLLKQFEKMPIRGILPYVLAAAYGLFDYRPQPFRVRLDDEPERRFKDPMVFTVANLTQYGGGARIAPSACPDDGFLELVVIPPQNVSGVIQGLTRLFDGTLTELKQVHSCRFRRLEVLRERPAPIQVDGEVVDAGESVTVDVLPQALKVLVP